jgi:hypothetical protein
VLVLLLVLLLSLPAAGAESGRRGPCRLPAMRGVVEREERARGTGELGEDVAGTVPTPSLSNCRRSDQACHSPGVRVLY